MRISPVRIIFIVDKFHHDFAAHICIVRYPSVAEAPRECMVGPVRAASGISSARPRRERKSSERLEEMADEDDDDGRSVGSRLVGRRGGRARSKIRIYPAYELCIMAVF